MDTTHTPDKTKFTLTGHPDMLPGVSEMAWTGDRTLNFIGRIFNGIPFTTFVTYDGTDPLFKIATGKLVPAFDDLAVEICPAKMTAGRRQQLLSIFPDNPFLLAYVP